MLMLDEYLFHNILDLFNTGELYRMAEISNINDFIRQI
jgi:hypothetical protein